MVGDVFVLALETERRAPAAAVVPEANLVVGPDVVVLLLRIAVVAHGVAVVVSNTST